MYGASVSINRTFSEGTHFVEYRAIDEAGNFARCSFHVTVTGLPVRVRFFNYVL